ncbi:MAG: hypothetical protein KAG10_07855, partial [Methylococcales bacterium]|nr:hypothetical protein [Methylococcales bacterium]
EKAGIPAIQSKQQLGTFAVKPLVYAYFSFPSSSLGMPTRFTNNTKKLVEMYSKQSFGTKIKGTMLINIERCCISQLFVDRKVCSGLPYPCHCYM